MLTTIFEPVIPLQMETEGSLPDPPSNATALASNATALAAAPTKPVELPLPSAQPAASAQPAISAQPAAVAASAPAQPQAPADSQQQQANGVDTAADGEPDAMQEDNMPSFTSGTVLRFDLDSEDAADSTTLDFRAIRPVFGSKEGGVRHVEYRKVSQL